MHLLVGIDTEGDNQWDAAARANQTFENIYALPRLHALFARHGVRPTYVITYPVATDARSGEVLRDLLARGDCEIGAHHHAWETPPFDADDVRRHAYALQLPRDRFEAQLASLTAAIERAVGRRPVSYRSGRYGFSAEHVAGLERLGYTVESSVAPLFYEAHKGGPDFVEAPLTPYFLAYDNPVARGSSNVLEVPVSAALDRRLPAWLQFAYARAPYPYQTKRVLRALRLLRMRWLRPSYSSLDDMRSLARDLARWQQPALNLLFHSSEAIVGGSPYNRTQAELDAFCERLERFFEYAIRELGARPATFSEFRAAYCEEPAGVVPPEGGSHPRGGTHRSPRGRSHEPAPPRTGEPAASDHSH
jgi:peptidoglycan/xylan/chitin deacetylase (PgdA/CDA1 family)